MRCAALLLIAALPALSQGPAPLNPAPQAPARKVDPARVEISPKGLVQLPSLGPKERRLQQYQFTNKSKAPITFRVQDTPGGILVFGPAIEAPIPAGETAPLTVAIDAEELTGFQTRRIKLITDDPGQGPYMLPLRFEVRPDLTVNGETQTLKDVAPHESPTATFTFTRETGTPLTLKVTNGLPPYLELDPVLTGPKGDLRVVLRPSKVPDGMRMGLETLMVETNAPKEPAFRLQLAWNLAYPVEATPTRVVFLDEKITAQTLTLASRDGKPFRLKATQVEGEGFKVTHAQAGPSPKVVLAVKRTAQATAKAVLIVTLEGQEAPLRIPLSFLPPTR